MQDVNIHQLETLSSYSTQFCDQCPTDMPEHRAVGRWVFMEGHEHVLPVVRPDVYLSEPDGDKPWQAFLPISDGNGWRGQKMFATQSEAMNYAATELVRIAVEEQGKGRVEPEWPTGNETTPKESKDV